MKKVILSADIGTSSFKAAYIDFNGYLLAFIRSTYNMGASSFDWEKAFFSALEALHAQAPGCGIECLCISGNGPTLVPVDASGQAMPPLYWFDGNFLSSAKMPSLEKKDKMGDSFFLPRAAWFKEKSPLAYKKTSRFFSSHEWLCFKLGAEPFAALPHRDYEPYYWDDEQCRLFGLDRKKFPPFMKMGSVVGKVSAEAAAKTTAKTAVKATTETAAKAARSLGQILLGGTPIIAGGPDFITALIGSGTVKEGLVCDRAGSSEGINVCASVRPVEQLSSSVPGIDLRVLPHAIEGLWNIGAVIPASGRLFEQYRSATAQGSRGYEELLAELIPIDSRLTSSHAAHSTIDKGQAVLCSIAFKVRSALEKLARAGFNVKEMRVSGGQGKSPLWNQLKADITGVTLVVPEICDAELAGNAVLSVAALSSNQDTRDMSFNETLFTEINRMIRMKEVYKPNPDRVFFCEGKI